MFGDLGDTGAWEFGVVRDSGGGGGSPAAAQPSPAAEQHLRDIVEDLKLARRSGPPRRALSGVPVLFAGAAALNRHFRQRAPGWAGGLGPQLKQCPVKRRRRAVQKMFRACVTWHMFRAAAEWAGPRQVEN